MNTFLPLHPPHRSFPVLALFLATIPARAAIPVGQNLLVNGSGSADLATGWTSLAAGGNGWGRSGSGGYDATPGYFITSYGLCRRSQTIDLMAAGVTETEMDAAPPIRISEAINNYQASSGLQAGVDTYYLRVELRNATGGVVAAFDAGTSAARKSANGSWIIESHEFRNYGPGVRSIYFEDGGMDGGNWAGHYGTYHDAARVEFLNQPVTEITATPSAFASNVAAGAIAAQLQAVDGDNAVHTFALESEIATTTQNLLTAREPGWRYYDQAIDPPADWMSYSFDDSAWASGPAPLGYDSGNADTWKQTQISYGANASAKPLTAWFRKTFTLADPSAISALSATVMIDDGCVVYLNGQELFRDGMPEGTVTSTTPANRTVGGADESDYGPIVIPQDKLSLLVPGVNVIAIEAHQDKITSSDLSIDLTLTATIAGAVNSYSNDLFEISGTELRLRSGSAGLPEGTYTVRVRATDPAGNTLVKLLDLQRTAAVLSNAPTGLGLTPLTIMENLEPGTVAGTLSVTDADTGEAHGFSLLAGPGGDDNALFTISNNRLLVAQKPDFETRPSLSVLVQVSDSLGQTFTAPFVITVTDDTTEDADGDRLTEAQEDLNNDGVLDANETDPFDADTDNDGYDDYVERNSDGDPRDPAVVPSRIQLRQLTSHATGESWLTAASWQDSTVPGSIHYTLTDGLVLRPPPVADPVFPSVAAELQNGAIFRLKHTGTLVIPRIVLRNATLQHGMTESISVGGPGSVLEIPTTATIDTATATLMLNSALSGPGSVRVIGTGAGRLELGVPAQAFTGELSLEAPETVIVDPGAVTGARRIQFKSGTLSSTGELQLGSAILQRSGTGRLSLSSSITTGAFIADGVILPAGSYTGTQLIAAGVPAAAINDLGGILTVTGDPTADADGDGATDLTELLAGTNPNDPASILRMAAVTPGAAAGNFTVTWTAVPGITYTVQFSGSLTGPWQDLGTVTPATTAGTYAATVPAPVPSTGFFRLILK